MGRRRSRTKALERIGTLFPAEAIEISTVKPGLNVWKARIPLREAHRLSRLPFHNSHQIAPMILQTDKTQGVTSLRLFNPSECQEIVEKLAQLENWNEALVRHSNGRNYDDVRNPDVRLASMPNSADVAWLYHEFESRIDLQIKPFVRKHWKLSLDKQSDTQLLKYEAAGHYRPHKDTGVDLEKRLFSIICYLNDDFEGGRTVFPPLDYAVTPTAGLALVFPSTYMHGSEPVTAGRKLVLVSWLDGPVPIKWL